MSGISAHFPGHWPVQSQQYDPKEILALLLTEARHDKSRPTGSRNALFARLYFYTTRHWIKRAAKCDDPELLHLMVLHFYTLYARYVVEVDRHQTSTTASHWQLYRLIAHRQRSAIGGFFQTLALILGIRAHTRFDLAEAICFAHCQYTMRHGRAPDHSHFHSLLFGKASDAVFRDASVAFVVSLVRCPKQGALLKRVLKPASRLWLPLFQGARKMAWTEATRSISSGRQIARRQRLVAGGLAI